MEVMDRVTKGLVQGGGHNQLMGPKFSPMLYVPGVGPHGQEMPYPSDGFKLTWGNWGIAANPPPATATPANSRPLTFPPQPQTKVS